MSSAGPGMPVGQTYTAVAGAVFSLLLLIVCASDLRARRIPNKIVLLLAVLGVIHSTLVTGSARGVLLALAGMALGLAIWLPFYAFGFLGAGDVKFFAAACAWIGPAAVVRAALLSALCGALLVVVWSLGHAVRDYVVDSRRPAAASADTVASMDARYTRRRLPYGLAMAAGLSATVWLPHLLVFRR
jgi:prepilin peptidase CpaA